MYPSREKHELHTKFWYEIFKGRDHTGDYIGTEGRQALKQILRVKYML
jgi:hypothetical protein